MNLFEVFDKETDQEREYYQAKKPLAVILAILGILAMCLCTPAGATYIESWLLELLPFGATGAAWTIAIGFDLTFAYLLSHTFRDIFSGMNGRKTYWDIPTIGLAIGFGAITLCWSLWGGNMRKAKASKEIAQAQAKVIDSTYHAATAMLKGSEQVTKTTKDISRDARKNNENIVKDNAEKTAQLGLLSAITDKKIETTSKAEIHRHTIIENGKMIIVGAYIFLLLSIMAIEYIKSQKSSDSKSDKKPGKSGQKQSKSNGKSIGFFSPGEGHILNGTIAFKKADGSIKYYKPYQLTSMIGDAEKKGKQERAEKLKGLKEKLINA